MRGLIVGLLLVGAVAAHAQGTRDPLTFVGNSVTTAGGKALYGDGSDGTSTVSPVDGLTVCCGTLGADCTLQRDSNCSSITTGAHTLTVTSAAGSFSIHSRGMVWISTGGAISAKGANGSTTSTVRGPIGNSVGGGQGGCGSDGLAGSSIATTSGGAGGLGGAGGAGGNASVQNGGAGGTVAAPLVARGGFRFPPASLLGRVISSSTTAANIVSILGGGGGGGGGGEDFGCGGNPAHGGAGGGVVNIAASTIRLDGVIDVRGGNGVTPTGEVQNTGGGGGGGGGAVFLTRGSRRGKCPSGCTSGTYFLLTGGAGGTGVNGGANGANGTASTALNALIEVVN